MLPRPSLLMMTAAASALAIAANGISIASAPPADEAARTRLGSSIQEDLNARDAAAAKRNRAIELREQAARAAEARLKNQLDSGQQAQAQPATAGPNGGPPPEDEQYIELARIYQAMKPAKAAIVFEQLEMDVQMKVAQRMRERSTAMIMAAMTPRAAAALSMALARKNARAAVPTVAPRTPAPQTAQVQPQRRAQPAPRPAARPAGRPAAAPAAAPVAEKPGA